MIRSRFSAWSAAVVALSTTLALGACGGSASPTTEVTPETPETVASTIAGAPGVPPDGTLGDGESRLTTAQASTFSKVLTKNRADAGASFAATIPFGPAATFTLTGDVDWVTYSANATLETTRSDGEAEKPVKLFWQTGQLAQEVPGLEQALVAKGKPAAQYSARPINPKSSPLDRVIVLINSMSNARPENPILLRQRTDVAFGGSTDLNGVPHDKYRYGSTTYWIDKSGATGKLVAAFKDFAGPVEIVFSDKGPKTLKLPPPESVVAAESIADVLDSLKKISTTATAEPVK
jgi:hypothetical protein